ncbi:hypothetical protein CEXT_162611 [Caerostris extrusa]|uniref:Uncharacterized protein n=1 Tax=Caerostris extrusa TaxID=172846 RepID=A0AAV4N500_CAEEX|nr:hypothetical protein CEXT_162611 [Caerostris extrusa]
MRKGGKIERKVFHLFYVGDGGHLIVKLRSKKVYTVKNGTFWEQHFVPHGFRVLKGMRKHCQRKIQGDLPTKKQCETLLVYIFCECSKT